jgi:putative SOS response-associated peptidase YedK
MCVQYLTTANVEWVKSHFHLDLPPIPAQDVFPTQSGPIVLHSHQSLRTAIGMARFGLVPAWAKEATFGKKTYNARAETVASKPSYRLAWKSRHYAIALVDSFYEPCYESGKAVRTRIQQSNDAPMGIASLWDTWTDPESGALVVSFTMLTINADVHPVMRRFHKPEEEKRTIIPLRPELFHDWLTATPESAKQLLQPSSMTEIRIA